MSITGFGALTTPADTDRFWVEQGGADFYATRAQIVAKVAADLAAEIATTDAEITALDTTRIKKDGTIAMTGDLTLSGAPSSNLHAASKLYVDTADALKANLASPTFTGTPAAPTAAAGTNTTQVATTAHVFAEIDKATATRTVVAAASKTPTEAESGYLDVSYTATGICTITLPVISTLTNKVRTHYEIKDIGFNALTNNIVVNAGAGNTIENGLSTISITTNGESISLYNDGSTSWYIKNVDTVASTTSQGVVELATDAEALALTDSTRALTASNLAAVLDVELYKTTELGAASKTLAEADSGTWYVTYTTTGAVAITLPDPSGLTDATKVVYEIVDAGAASTNNITITSAAGTIDGGASSVISNTGAGAKFINDGTNWRTSNNTQKAIDTAIATSTASDTAFSTLSGPGAIPLTQYRHRFTSTGTADALTLANGTNGQKILIHYVAEGASGDSAVLTPANLFAYTTITFNDLGDSVELMYDSTSAAWLIINVFNATIA